MTGELRDPAYMSSRARGCPFALQKELRRRWRRLGWIPAASEADRSPTLSSARAILTRRISDHHLRSTIWTPSDKPVLVETCGTMSESTRPDTAPVPALSSSAVPRCSGWHVRFQRSNFPMKTGLDHLPLHKREQISAVAALVKASTQVEMIILFGSYARGDWVEDLANGYFSDFDLMVIVATETLAEDEALWTRVGDQARLIGGRVPVTLVVHDIKQVNQEIRTGQYFFSDVVMEGIVLHDSRRFMLARPKAQSPAERLELARRNFIYWFQSASEFWRGAGYYAARGLGPHAAFSLHQATERYFHAVLLVYTGYKPKTHDIEVLAKQTAPLHPALEGALPRTSAEEQRLFSLLKRAYIEARYSKSYRVTDDELATLRNQVLDLASRVLESCTDKLATISPDSATGELPSPPSRDDAMELPSPPSLDDPKAVEAWRDALVRASYERGEMMRREGEAIGRARAIVDVLRRRSIVLADPQAARILACRDEATLARWWERAWSIVSVDELWRS